MTTKTESGQVETENCAAGSAKFLEKSALGHWALFTTALVFASAFVFVSLSSLLAANFGPVDDHEPLKWMGSDGALSPSEFVPTLLQTEVGQWGHSSAFDLPTTHCASVRRSSSETTQQRGIGQS